MSRRRGKAKWPIVLVMLCAALASGYFTSDYWMPLVSGEQETLYAKAVSDSQVENQNAAPENVSADNDVDTAAEEAAQDMAPTPADGSYLAFPDSRAGYPMPYYRSFLSEPAKGVYDAIVDAMEYMTEGEFSVPRYVDVEGLATVMEYAKADHPEIFWVDNEYNYNTYDGIVFSISLNYSMDRATKDELAAQVDAAACVMLNDASTLDGEYAKVRRYYELLSDSIEYDNALDSLQTQTVVGAFLGRRTACAGYSRAMQYLCYKSNIPCIYVSGFCSGSTEVPDGSHAWNAMSCDGTSFYTDVTWGDTDGSVQLPYTYTFLGLTQADILATSHVFKYPDLMPAADDPAYEEWAQSYTYFSSYDRGQVADVLVSKFSSGQRIVYLRFADQAQVQAFWDDYTGSNSAGGEALMDMASWIIGGDGYYRHYVVNTRWLNVVVYMWADS